MVPLRTFDFPVELYAVIALLALLFAIDAARLFLSTAVPSALRES